MGDADRKQNQSDKIPEGGMDFIPPTRDRQGPDETVTPESAPYGAEGLVDVVPRTTEEEVALSLLVPTGSSNTGSTGRRRPNPTGTRTNRGCSW